MFSKILPIIQHSLHYQLLFNNYHNTTFVTPMLTTLSRKIDQLKFVTMQKLKKHSIKSNHPSLYKCKNIKLTICNKCFNQRTVVLEALNILKVHLAITNRKFSRRKHIIIHIIIFKKLLPKPINNVHQVSEYFIFVKCAAQSVEWKKVRTVKRSTDVRVCSAQILIQDDPLPTFFGCN
jgi:hypothetical protein